MDVWRITYLQIIFCSEVIPRFRIIYSENMLLVFLNMFLIGLQECVSTLAFKAVLHTDALLSLAENMMDKNDVTCSILFIFCLLNFFQQTQQMSCPFFFFSYFCCVSMSVCVEPMWYMWGKHIATVCCRSQRTTL